MPQHFAGGGFQSDEVSLSVAGENQPACCRKHAGPRRRGMLPFPLYFPRGGIDGAQRAGERSGIIVRKIRAAIISVPRFVGLRRSAENVTLLSRGNVEKLRLRI